MGSLEQPVVANGGTTSPSPVIVVGAGPVGLLTAVRLTNAGIPTTVLEMLPAVEQSPRAAVYHPAAVRELDRAGVLTRCREVGSFSSSVCWRKLNGEIIAEMGRAPIKKGDGDDENKGNDYEVLVLGQHELANVILEAFEKNRPGEVLFEHKVVALEQDGGGGDEDGSGVTLTVQTPDGSQKKMKSRYVVGADGGRSTVRHLIGVEFEGFTWPKPIVATNVKYPFDKYGFLSGNFIVDKNHWALIAKLNGEDMWRCSYGELEGLTEEEMIKRQPMKFEAILPGPRPLEYEIKMLSPYKIHQRCSSTFRVGRVALAGDAAHLCNPFGGMGLTGGLLDAGALGDMLIPTIQNPKYADGGLLDKYSQVRRDIFLNVVNPMTQANIRRLFEPDPDTARHTDPFLKAIMDTDDEGRARMRKNAPALGIDMTQYVE